MKRIVLTAALSLAFAGSLAFAQQPQSAPAPQSQDGSQAAHGDWQHHGKHHNPHHEAMMLSRRLNLSPDQTARIEPILADREQKMAAIHANTALTPQDMHQQMRALHEQEKTQFAAVLTPEQQEQMKAMHHGHHDHGQGQPVPQPSAGL